MDDWRKRRNEGHMQETTDALLAQSDVQSTYLDSSFQISAIKGFLSSVQCPLHPSLVWTQAPDVRHGARKVICSNVDPRFCRREKSYSSV
eukprot:23830-Rhodomonas_salina.1